MADRRLYSIDALRGCDMLLITGLGGLISGICALSPDSAVMSFFSEQMHHAAWDGFTIHDTIFPLFLFIAGITFPFSLDSQMNRGMTRSRIYIKTIKRAIILFLLGLVYNGIFQGGDIRFCSVLGRIGIAWAIAAILYMNLRTLSLALLSVAILIGYWLMMWLIPDSPTPFTFEDNLVGVIDRAILPGRLCYGTFDPEGLLSTLPAVVTALLGMFTGKFIRLPEEKISGNRKVLWMFIAAAVLTGIALLWNNIFPVNKKLWTSSFVCAAGAYSLFFFALFYYIIDVRGAKKWTFPFRVIGMNSITIYLASAIIPFWEITKFFLGGVVSTVEGTPWEEIIMCSGLLAVEWLFLYFLYQKNTFLKV